MLIALTLSAFQHMDSCGAVMHPTELWLFGDLSRTFLPALVLEIKFNMHLIMPLVSQTIPHLSQE